MDLKKLAKEMKGESSRVRTTKTTCSLRGDYDRGRDGGKEALRFVRKNKHLLLEWHAHVPCESVERERCNLDHWHEIPKKTHWVWNYCELTKSDVEQLVQFLND